MDYSAPGHTIITNSRITRTVSGHKL